MTFFDVPTFHGNPEDAPLYLPSSFLRPDPAPSIDILEHLRTIEARLRQAQGYDALVRLHEAIHVHTHIYYYKNRQVQAQAANTRAQALLRRSEKLKQEAAARYRRTYHAIMCLAGPHDVFKKLNDADIVPMQADTIRTPFANMLDLLGESQRAVLWIWRMRGVDSETDSGEGKIK